METRNHTTSAALLDLAGSGPNTDNAAAETVMIMSVIAALRDRKDETTTAITAELTQMGVMKVWHGVNTADLDPQERRAIIRSKIFLKDKYLASGVFDKFKARLVAGGHLQDKTLYEKFIVTYSCPNICVYHGCYSGKGMQRACYY